MSIFEDYREWYNKGLVAFEQENYKDAIDHLLHALECDPKQLLVWSSLGVAYAFNKEYDNAIEIINDLFKFNPQIQKREDLAKHLYDSLPKEHYDIIEKMVINALEPDSKYEGPWETVGSYYLYKEDNEKAIEA